MFTRSLEKELVKWKSDPNRKPLIIRGARQVGKTSLVRQFAKHSFAGIFEFNLEKREHFRIFEGVDSVSDFLKRAEISLNQEFIPFQNLLFIDEIQESPEVMNLLRFFAEERSDIYLISTGSLLEAKLSKHFKIPVGRVDFRYLYPLTFLEYLGAVGKDQLAKEIKKVSLGENYGWDEIAKGEFKKYTFMGGMPEVVSDFIDKQDFFGVKQILSGLQTTYIEDVAKYMKKLSERKYLELVVEAGPRFAGSLFRYESFAGSEYRSREISDAFTTVEKAMLLTQVPSINSTNLPLVFKYRRPKKLIWLDAGIVNYSNNLYPELIKGVYGGRLMEQIVGQTLVAGFGGGPIKLGYWAKDKNKGSAEVDFCWQWRDKIVGLEVKSGSNLKSKSLSSMVKSGKGSVLPIQVSWNKLQIRPNGFLNLPFYLLERWEEILQQIPN